MKLTVDEREEAFGSGLERLKLEVVGPEHDPAAEGVSEVDDAGADHEPDDVWKRTFQGEDQHVVGVKEAEVPASLKR